MASVKTEYGSSSAVTITLASLASSSTLVAGRESTAIDNSTNKYLDFLLAGFVTTGTSPTAGTIEIDVVGCQDDTTWPDVFDGTDSNETITSSDIKNAICRYAASMVTDATSNRAYPFGPVSVASLFGGSLPKKWVVFCAHSTVASLNATGTNHSILITPVYATVA